MDEYKSRESRFAGSFYPGTVREIKAMLDIFIAKAGDPAFDRRPPILIIPHAGWIYSGLAAVRGLINLKAFPPERIILIGPSHRHYFLGFSPSGFESYRTPLGDLPVDTALQTALTDQTGFEFEPEAHIPEHSLEVILPMVQYILPGVKTILPILAGTVSKASISQLAESLSGLLDPIRDVVIVSSDLSHFYPYETARKLDLETIEYVLNGDGESLLGRSGDGGRLACGFAGMVVAIELGRRWDLGKPKLIMYYNSGDSGGDRNSVVGYASIGWPALDLGSI